MLKTEPIAETEHSGAPDDASEVALLVKQASGGDRFAFERIVSLFHEDIYRMIYYRTRSRSDAEDLTQEVFLGAMNQLEDSNNKEGVESC